MKTIVVVVSIGKRHHLLSKSMPRIVRYAARYGYSVGLITGAIQPTGKPPHYAKLRVPSHFPGFDRYCVIDDDILLSSTAPPLPNIPIGHVGLARDAVQENTTAEIVKWTGNSGFIVFDSSASKWLELACEHPMEPSVWGGWGDQGALNLILWRESKIFEIDTRWNFPPVLAYAQQVGWDRWQRKRRLRVWFYLNLLFNRNFETRRLISASWGVHLIHARYTRIFNFLTYGSR